MDYADIVGLDMDKHAYRDEGGNLWIKKQRKKARLQANDQIMHVPVMHVANAILQKYGNKVPIWMPEWNKVLSYDKYNKYLKEVADILGFKINLTTKTGRKTFINMMYEKGIPLEDISDMVGHNSTRITRSTYLRFSNKRIKDSIGRVFGEDWAG
jgi:integrase